MEGSWAAFLTPIWTENCGAFLIAEVTCYVLEFLECEEEVVELTSWVTFFLALLHFLSPHGAVNMHELINLERNQTSCDGSFSLKPTQKAL